MENHSGDSTAVILALWQSIEANEAFLASKAAVCINQQLQSLISGPTKMTRWRLGVGAYLLDYIPYTNFRKYKMPSATLQSMSPPVTLRSWLPNVKGLNVLSECLDECSDNQGCHACAHSSCRRGGRLVMLSLNGLSPDSLRNRIVQSEKGAELVSLFTVEWITSIGSEGSSDWGSPVSREETPPQRVNRESPVSEPRSYWNTILGDNSESP